MARTDVLGTPLLDLGGGDRLTLRDCAQNIFCTGVTGGGKTSGPGRHILTALARSGAGGIILCAKPSEAEEVCATLRKAGRGSSVIVWNGRNHRFNFLAYAQARLGEDGTNSQVEYLLRIVEMARGASALPGHNGDSFWTDELRRVLRNTLPVVNAAQRGLRLDDMLAFVRGAPTSPEQFTDPAWQAQRNAFMRGCVAASQVLDEATGERMVAYWRDDFARMDQKLRSNILAGFTLLDRFNHGWMREAFTGATSIVPALCFHGAIIILDMSRATLGEDGVLAQMIFKDAFFTDVLARNALAPQHRERFVFCYADEAQEFITSRDAEFLALSRSSRCGSIYLTQNLPSIYAKIPGQNPHDRAQQLIGNMGVRILCANHCTVTNQWAAETLGKAVQQRASFNASSGTNRSFGANMGEGTNWGTSSNFGSSWSPDGKGGAARSFNSGTGSSSGGNDSRGRNRGYGENHGTSHGWAEQSDFILDAGFFARGLKTGGPAHGFRVSAVWVQAGRQFRASGGNALLVEFSQK